MLSVHIIRIHGEIHIHGEIYILFLSDYYEQVHLQNITSGTKNLSEVHDELYLIYIKLTI